ncbi:MAG: hypothetical protein Unbinned3138contig1000_49 [Prokaryotic dsDNA virus sp.]|nr:MAG: hypothetical protein Unbinned3138contig1000_49 [Prokaryotic dsDNA virus sp.]|tara:strand:+ start:13931 stop:14437 length:507 start_codon:yes stop_codon:yes gene_type:complete
MPSKYSDIRDLDTANMTIHDIADHYGVTYKVANQAVWRHNVPYSSGHAPSIRSRVADMKPTDAVEYLLQCLEDMSEILTGSTSTHPVDDLPVKFGPKERRAMAVLWDAEGLLVSHQNLFKAYNFGDFDKSDMDSLNSRIKGMRRKLPEDMKIVNVTGEGFRLTRPGVE